MAQIPPKLLDSLKQLLEEQVRLCEECYYSEPSVRRVATGRVIFNGYHTGACCDEHGREHETAIRKAESKGTNRGIDGVVPLNQSELLLSIYRQVEGDCECEGDEC